MKNIPRYPRSAALMTLLTAFAFYGAPAQTPKRAMVAWQGRTIEAAEDQIALKVKNGVSRQALEARIRPFGANVVYGPDDMGIVRLQLPKSTGVSQAIQSAEAIDLIETAGPIAATHTSISPNDPSYGSQWGPGKINTTYAWEVSTGSSNIILGILDTGIPLQNNSLSHPDLQNSSRIILGADETGDGQGVHDANGHGTHVAGIASAETNNGTGVAGVSWNSRTFVVQVFDSLGSGWDYMVYNGVRNAVDNGAKIINFSGGQMGPSPNMEAAVQYAYNHGVLFVAAAGNYQQTSNPNRIVEWPAAYSTIYSNVIAVSSTTSVDVIADGSSRGPAINVAAPGQGIYSTLPNYQVRRNLYPYYNSQNYDILSGTSMAAPHVAGLAALMYSVGPNLTPSQIRNTIQQTADDLGTSGFDTLYGYGRVNAFKSVVNAYSLARPGTVPTIGTASLARYDENFKMTFLSGPAPNLSAGDYICDRWYADVNAGPYSSTPDGWYPSEQKGYRWSNPNDASRWLLNETTSNSRHFQTVFYYIKTTYPPSQQINQLVPFDPNPSSLRTYAAVGTPCTFSAYISGPTVGPCATGTWTANVTGCYPPYHYQWWQMWSSGGGGEVAVATSSKSGGIHPDKPIDEWWQVGTDSPTLQLYWCGGNGYLRVDVTDARGSLVSTQYYVAGADGGGGGARVNNANEEQALAANQLPATFSVGSHPNPFNPSATIDYQLPMLSHVQLSVFDALGRHLEVLADETKSAGYYSSTFDASRFPSGVYFARIAVTPSEGKPFVQTLKLLLSK